MKRIFQSDTIREQNYKIIEILNFLIGLTVGIMFALAVGFFRSVNNQPKQPIYQILMDESCYKQILNNSDGIIRLKIN